VVFFLSYFNRPLRIFGAAGLVTSLIGGCMLLYLTYDKLILGHNIGERPLLILAVLLIVLGVQLMSTGLIADMVMRTYHESRNEPVYHIREHLASQPSEVAQTVN
jgi:hypothetical protein